MTDIQQLYQEVILDHNRRPRNFHKLEGANRKAEGYNPLCGDNVAVYLTVEDGVVKDISFEGSGCAISTASASMMTTALKGKTTAEVEAIFEKFRSMVTQDSDMPSDPQELGKLKVFSGVCEFPVRVKCVTLAWHTLISALRSDGKVVSTE